MPEVLRGVYCPSCRRMWFKAFGRGTMLEIKCPLCHGVFRVVGAGDVIERVTESRLARRSA